MSKKRIGIVGATGFTGSELVRLLLHHPEVELSVITSESRAGERFSEVHPFFYGIADHELVRAKEIDQYELDLVFLALPHGVSMDFVREFEEKPFKIIDLSGDFRLDSPQVYEEWYNKTHSYPKGFEQAVYGIPELFKDAIKQASLVANPGCYPTSALLGLAPLLAQNWIEPGHIIVDSKSGVTGAGVKAKPVNHFSNVNDNFKAYGLKNHRHTIEIEGVSNRLSKQSAKVQFTPHLLPVDRGILSTIYLQPREEVHEQQILNLFADYYEDAPFIRLKQSPPSIKEVRGTNYCDIYPTYDERTQGIIVVSVIDNLMKGAAGQAVQNMNLLFGWPETSGLQQIPLHP
jgi:N-acetyl-gamma-glutamyl-phosphate reductase